MTVITGETGAGKSIAIDASAFVSVVALKPTWCVPALLCRPVRPFFSERYASGPALAGENQLEDGHECLLRRVISSDVAHEVLSTVQLFLCHNFANWPVADSDPWSARPSVTHQTRAQKFLLDGYANETSLLQEMTDVISCGIKAAVTSRIINS